MDVLPPFLRLGSAFKHGLFCERPNTLIDSHRLIEQGITGLSTVSYQTLLRHYLGQFEWADIGTSSCRDQPLFAGPSFERYDHALIGCLGRVLMLEFAPVRYGAGEYLISRLHMLCVPLGAYSVPFLVVVPVVQFLLCHLRPTHARCLRPIGIALEYEWVLERALREGQGVYVIVLREWLENDAGRRRLRRGQ